MKPSIAAVNAPDFRSAVGRALCPPVRATVRPPRAVGAMPEPALSTIKLLAAEMVEAVTVNVGAAARSVGPFVLDTEKLLPLPTTLPADDDGQEAVGVVQET